MRLISKTWRRTLAKIRVAATRRRLICCVLTVIGGSAFADTQDIDPRLPTFFIGSGFGISTNDAKSRMRIFVDDGPRPAVAFEAGVALRARLGIGIEFSRPSAAAAFTYVGQGRAQIAGRQEEHVIVGLLRARLAASRRVAFDLVGGAGVLFQRHLTGECSPSVVDCRDTSGPMIEEHAPAFVAGIDIPFRAGKHLDLVATLRAYRLSRGENAPAPGFLLPWQYEWRSSTRGLAMLNARLVW